MRIEGPKRGVIIVDHGSRLAESNRLVEELALVFSKLPQNEEVLVQPAHMELAEPGISTAYSELVRQGATEIVVLPYFLGPGKHWSKDIPALIANAAEQYSHTSWKLAAPLGIDSLIVQLLLKRMQEVTVEIPAISGSSEPGSATR